MSRTQGFTLIELIVTVVIVAILAAIALPSYSQYVRKSNRALAVTTLQELTNRQQNYMLDARLYADTLAKLSVTLAPEISEHYDVSVAVNNGATPPSYTFTATPKSSMQLSDTECGALSISNTGKQTITGSGNVADCW